MKEFFKKRPIRVCPKCGSTNVEKPLTALTAIGVNNQFGCGECGFESSLFLEVTKKKRK
jgi:predicted nucleic-acid-binding Zn-ribbon protein